MKDGRFSKYFIYGLVISISGIICICFYFLVTNGAESLIAMKNGFVKMMLPFIDAFCIAFLLNPILKFIENKGIIPFLKKNNKYKNENKQNIHIRSLALFFTYIIFFLVMYGMIMLVIPQLVESIQSIALRIPTYNTNDFVSNAIKNNDDWANLFDTYSDNFEAYITGTFLPDIQRTISRWSSALLGSVVEILVGLFKFIIGIILSVYILAKKEIYCAQFKKMFYAFLSEERANNLINNIRFTNKTFGGFFIGKIIDSLIIALICFVAISILKIPYAILISAIVGVTNIIPFFGPYLGAIPSILIIFMINPMKSLVFIVFIILLQQFDGNILGPKILGESTGLSGFWVIFAITLFGGLFGIAGMFVGVPIFAVIYAAIRAYIESKLLKKDMPVVTKYYMESDYHSKEDDIQNVGDKFRLHSKNYTKKKTVDNNVTDPVNETTNI